MRHKMVILMVTLMVGICTNVVSAQPNREIDKICGEVLVKYLEEQGVKPMTIQSCCRTAARYDRTSKMGKYEALRKAFDLAGVFEKTLNEKTIEKAITLLKEDDKKQSVVSLVLKKDIMDRVFIWSNIDVTEQVIKSVAKEIDLRSTIKRLHINDETEMHIMFPKVKDSALQHWLKVFPNQQWEKDDNKIRITCVLGKKELKHIEIILELTEIEGLGKVCILVHFKSNNKEGITILKDKYRFYTKKFIEQELASIRKQHTTKLIKECQLDDNSVKNLTKQLLDKYTSRTRNGDKQQPKMTLKDLERVIRMSGDKGKQVDFSDLKFTTSFDKNSLKCNIRVQGVVNVRLKPTIDQSIEVVKENGKWKIVENPLVGEWVIDIGTTKKLLEAKKDEQNLLGLAFISGMKLIFTQNKMTLHILDDKKVQDYRIIGRHKDIITIERSGGKQMELEFIGENRIKFVPDKKDMFPIIMKKTND